MKKEKENNQTQNFQAQNFQNQNFQLEKLLQERIIVLSIEKYNELIKNSIINLAIQIFFNVKFKEYIFEHFKFRKMPLIEIERKELVILERKN